MIEVKHSTGDEWVVTIKSTVTTHHRVRVTKKMSNVSLGADSPKNYSKRASGFFWSASRMPQFSRHLICL